MSETVHLTDRNPRVSPDELVDDLVPPPHFSTVSFDSYRPDPAQPTQAQACDALAAFAEQPAKRGFLSKLMGKEDRSKGIYLDGGYGVGKTHLLASAWHRAEKPAAFGTFVEYTNLIGALGFPRARDVLTQMKLVCIDEFELDDPGDTVMMSRLMRELTDAGVRIVATSNTLPGALGEGRFAAQDFLREIQALSDQFDVLHIDGDDYRHRDLDTPPEPVSREELDRLESEAQGVVARDDFAGLLDHLQSVHPSKYRRMMDDVSEVLWDYVVTIDHEGVALRFVALVDRLYDRGAAMHNSGVRTDAIFTDEMLHGGYRKKYMRCLSRLTAMASGAER
ncbi:cell division protein ZapE [Brevibacterium sp. 5221]|uniref:Cell division protein ZapE n=1 Tax=Brevibacterium rongguiense TaxID=2695267 RepID=A0A6N9H934_9MICO|nr:cell division protein ZapE [Brevibacterium rongguiense]MYM20547.1 cell division protein ZapE [Brevibacterium rongguiense]